MQSKPEGVGSVQAKPMTASHLPGTLYMMAGPSSSAEAKCLTRPAQPLNLREIVQFYRPLHAETAVEQIFNMVYLKVCKTHLAWRSCHSMG